MNKTIWLATTALVAMSVAASPAFAGRSSAEKRESELSELKARIEKLEQEAAAAKAEADDAAIATSSRLKQVEDTQNAVQWSFSNGRPSVRSGDGRFELAFRGRFMFDMASYDQDASDFGNGYGAGCTAAACDQGDGAFFRRVRFGMEGRFFRDFVYEMRFDFGGSNNAEGNGVVNIMRVGYTGIPNTRIHLGAIQPIMTMYDATSSADLTSMERPGIITSLVGTFGGDNSRRGIEATWQKEDLFYPGSNFILSAAYTGERVGSTHTSALVNNDENTHLLGRAAWRVWSEGGSNVQIGATGSMILNADNGSVQVGAQPEIRVNSTQFVQTPVINVEDGGNHAYGVEFGANFKNFYVAAEWYKMEFDQKASVIDPEFSGWYVEGEWILTGESKGYTAGGVNNNVGVFKGPSIAAPWSYGGGTGAWSLHARHSVLDLNFNEGTTGVAAVAGTNFRGGEQTITNLGVTWYINSNLKMMGEYAMVEIDRADTDTDSLNAEFQVIQGRAMFTF